MKILISPEYQKFKEEMQFIKGGKYFLARINGFEKKLKNSNLVVNSEMLYLLTQYILERPCILDANKFSNKIQGGVNNFFNTFQFSLFNTELFLKGNELTVTASEHVKLLFPIFFYFFYNWRNRKEEAKMKIYFTDNVKILGESSIDISKLERFRDNMWEDKADKKVKKEFNF